MNQVAALNGNLTIVCLLLEGALGRALTQVPLVCFSHGIQCLLYNRPLFLMHYKRPLFVPLALQNPSSLP